MTEPRYGLDDDLHEVAGEPGERRYGLDDLNSVEGEPGAVIP